MTSSGLGFQDSSDQKELSDYFTSMGVENYYSTAYEPWQDGLAEAAVKSVMMLARCGMAGSGLAGPYWFCAATNGKDCRNVTTRNESRIPHGDCSTMRNEIYPSSDLLDAGVICT